MAATGSDVASILHVDMDAFYASVEQRRRPELRGRPVVVGGEGPRGVVAAASYEARVYGVRSAMASATARRLCPDAIFVAGDHAHYAEVSGSIMAIFSRYTPLVEPLSLDEAFLDVGGARRLHGSAARIGAAIRHDVYAAERLRCSVGGGPNKFVAKLATEHAKPRPSTAGPVPGLGVHVVEPNDVRTFLDPLPIRALWGVGPKTADRLDRLGVATVADLALIPLPSLVAALGRAHGTQLHRLARGLDDRRVEADLAPKSVSHEETFAHDLFERDRIRSEVGRMADAVGRRLRAADRRGRTVQLKVRFADFTTITRSFTLRAPTDSGAEIAGAACTMIEQVDCTPGVRLLGVGVSAFEAGSGATQLTFDDLLGDEPQTSEDWRAAEGAMDRIRDRFGSSAIGPASTLGPNGPRTKVAGQQQWGPAADDLGDG